MKLPQNSTFKILPIGNLLEHWKMECYIISSPIQIQAKIERKVVDRIYNTLCEFFGLNYFRPQRRATPIHKANWLHALVANHQSIGCIKALEDIVSLLDYSRSLPEEIQKMLAVLKGNPDNLRSFFFELFTFRMLDFNKVPNLKKVFEGQQEKEGVCTIGGLDFLFECKKLYMPHIEKLDIRKAVLSEIVLQLQHLKFGTGIIIYAKFKEPVDNSIKDIFRDKIQNFVNGLNRRTSISQINYHDESQHGTLSVINYSEADAFEMENLKKDWDVYFKLVPPPIMTPGIPAKFIAHGDTKFSIERSKVTDKLIAALKQKRKQHQSSAFENRIFFFDSESFPEVRMGLFQYENMLDANAIQEYMNQSSSKDLLCIINRRYWGKELRINVNVFCKNELNPIKKIIEGWDFFTGLPLAYS